MTNDTEGMLIAYGCMTHALIATMITKKMLSPNEVTSLLGEAEEFLAGMSPSLMTPDARDYARRILQGFGRIFLKPHG